jgi:hypothetical protein
MQMSSGHLLAAGLDGGNRTIFTNGENADQVPPRAPKEKDIQLDVFFFYSKK